MNSKNTYNQLLPPEKEEHHTTQNNFHKESLSLMDHSGFGVTRVRFAVLDQNVGLRTLGHQRLRWIVHAVRCRVTLFLLYQLFLLSVTLYEGAGIDAGEGAF